ncbi:MAG TPA: citramalate synthase, partial [Armatimonadetes bacterium]|nr:citramalate synthase [Armatimonadota bacterium]
KLHLTRCLDELGLDYIEGGWPNATNEKDCEFFRRAQALTLRQARLVAFGSTRRKNIAAADDSNLNYLLAAETAVVTIFGKSWDLHVTEVLGTSREENLRMIEDSVAYLKGHGREVIYDAEHFFDGYRARPEYALETLRAAARGGADWIVLCDTNGGTMPWEIEAAIRAAQRTVEVPLGIHAHNDAGLGVANTLVAVRAGVQQVQGTMNGYGERCGNANFCQVIPNLKLKLGYECVGEEQLQQLTALSRLISELANLPPDDRQGYVGASAFAHKGGAHIDGVLKTQGRAFEHVPPEVVGNRRRLLLSEQSGTSTIVAKLENLVPGLDKRDPVVAQLLAEVKEREFEGYQFEGADASFELLAQRLLRQYEPPFNLKAFRVIVERREDGRMYSEATLKMDVHGSECHTVAEGDGPVHALDRALRKALREFYPHLDEIQLTDYKVRVLDSRAGTAARVRVLIESSDRERTWGTCGVSHNIIEASWEALADSFDYGLRGQNEGNET